MIGWFCNICTRCIGCSASHVANCSCFDEGAAEIEFRTTGSSKLMRPRFQTQAIQIDASSIVISKIVKVSKTQQSREYVRSDGCMFQCLDKAEDEDLR